MTFPVAMKPTRGLISPLSKGPGKPQTIKEIIFRDDTKAILNYACNGAASLFGFLTFLSANFHLFDSIQDKLDYFSERLERLGNGLSGAIGAIDLWQKKNLLPFLGYTSMIPVSAFIDGYNNWLARGISIGLNSFVFIIDRREVVDENGEPEIDKKTGKPKCLSGDFSDSGWIESIKVSCKESIKMLRELFQNPKKITTFSHAVLTTALFQMAGPIIHTLGAKKLGSTIRNIAGIAGYIALLLDRRKEGAPFGGINFKSPVVQCSLLRIGTAFFDQLKHFEFFSSRISNLTDLSLSLDRLAGLRFTKGIFDIKKSR